MCRHSVHSGLFVRTTLDPAGTPFLDDHRIDGTPVLPGVMGMESFVEAARLLVPDRYLAGLENVDFRAPVKFYRDEPRTLTVTARVRPDGTDLVADCTLSAERTLPGTLAILPQPIRTRSAAAANAKAHRMGASMADDGLIGSVKARLKHLHRSGRGRE